MLSTTQEETHSVLSLLREVLYDLRHSTLCKNSGLSQLCKNHQRGNIFIYDDIDKVLDTTDSVTIPMLSV